MLNLKDLAKKKCLLLLLDGEFIKAPPKLRSKISQCKPSTLIIERLSTFLDLSKNSIAGIIKVLPNGTLDLSHGVHQARAL